MQIPVSTARAAAIAAIVLFAGAVLAFGALAPGYVPTQQPVALLGATMVPNAVVFNMLAFVLPGLLAAVVAVALRGPLDRAGWPARIGAQALLLSALAFAAQGVAPLDSSDVESTASRLHGTLWSLWWMAFAVAGGLLAWGLRPTPLGRTGQAVAACAAATLVFALLAPIALPPGLSQRLAYAMWFIALLLIPRGLSRSAA